MPSLSMPLSPYTAQRSRRPIVSKTRSRTRRVSLALIAFIVGGSAALSGCAPIILGGAVIGASALYDRRHYQIVIDDEQIELSALYALARDPDIDAHAKISATSYGHVLLLTGQADSESVAQRAADLVSRIPKVDRVVDEVDIGPRIGLKRESKDTYITSRAKLALARIDLPDFNPARVKVVTEDAVVYLMGLVTRAEADAAADRISYVPGVRRVVKLFQYDVSDA